jgi:hypothetical protein
VTVTNATVKDGNFCDKCGNATKSHITEQHIRNMGYMDKWDRMANSFSISCHTLKWTTELFFYLLDITILNGYILLSSCCDQTNSHREFHLCLVQNTLAHAGKQPCPKT